MIPFAQAIPLGAGDRRLILAGLAQWGLWLAAGLAAVALILVLYRYERKIVSRRAGLSLLGLRLLAALVLVAALFEPIASRTYKETVRGRVILGVDLSQSMATADAGRSAEDRLKLARMPGASSLDMSAPPSRQEIARRLVSGPWIEPIAAVHDIEAVGFARSANGDGNVSALAERLKTPPGPDDPQGSGTDWTEVLERGLKDDGRPIVGVVLLTDGQSNGADPGNAAADKLAARGIPIYPVLIGSTNRPVDAAIAGVKAPERVSRGDAADIEVTLKIDGPAPGTEVPVTLDRPGSSPLKKLVKVPADGSRPVVAFRVNLESAGLQSLTATVGPIDGDLRADNDRRAVPIEVTDDRTRVLLVDGQARWEFQYLRNALMRDPQVTLESVVFHQPTLAAGDPSYKAALPVRAESGESAGAPDPLGSFDVIILGDVGPDDLKEGDWSRIQWYVDVRGGTLVMASGPRQMSAIGSHEIARKLLPVVDPSPVVVDPTKLDRDRPALAPGAGLTPDPSAAYDAYPMLRLDAEPEASLAVWKGLPRLPWVVAGKAKPLASTLATIADTSTLSGADAGVAIAAQPYGLGKVLWVGTDGTWRWRYLVGDKHHHRFWGQVVRWANAPKLAVGNRLVRYGPTRPRVQEGAASTIRAQFGDDAPGVKADLLVAARVFRKGPDGKPTGEAVAVVPLRARADQPRTFEAAAPPLPQGSYAILLDAPQLGEEAPKDGAPLEVLARSTSERTELAANRDPLDRLAATTGGKVFADVDADGLSALLKARTLDRERTEETSLWDRPWALALFFAVLTVEWIIRKRSGLP